MLHISRQFVRFSIVGAVGFLVDASILYAILHGSSLGPYSSRVFSYLIAATTTWYLNRIFTFKGLSNSPPRQQWAKFVFVNVFGGAVNYGVFAILIALKTQYLSEPILAVAIGSIAGLVFNFTLSRSFVFVSR